MKRHTLRFCSVNNVKKLVEALIDEDIEFSYTLEYNIHLGEDMYCIAFDVEEEENE